MERPPIFLKTILDSITEGVFTVNEDWIITSFNRAAEKITGFPREKAIGKKCFEIFQADICQSACALGRTLKNGKPLLDLPVNILNGQGRTVPISISTAVLKNHRGQVIGGVETFRDLSVLEALRKELTRQYSLGDIIGKSAPLQKIFGLLPDIARSDSSVLIQGPSGSGKELLAQALHQISPRRDKPFVAINCSALPETLLESELFGYVRGAFTDAKKDKPGKFSQADSGTLLFDEIGDMPLSLQAKLLRVLQEKTYEPLGSNRPRDLKARLVSATNKDLKQLIETGRFREDLYYRLKVIQINLPTLRERREDIPLLIDHFIRKFNRHQGKKIERVSAEVLEILMHYEYPGHIRELENIIEHAFVLCRGTVIQKNHLPPEVLLLPEGENSAPLPFSEKTLKEKEWADIQRALRKYEGSRARAAKELGIHPATLWRKIRRYTPV
jgi:PAS domain S-box-containing protein